MIFHADLLQRMHGTWIKKAWIESLNSAKEKKKKEKKWEKKNYSYTLALPKPSVRIVYTICITAMTKINMWSWWIASLLMRGAFPCKYHLEKVIEFPIVLFLFSSFKQ